MYEIFVESHFDAAHALRGYRGKCETMHGHRFKVVVRVRAAGLNEIGIAYDFAELKKDLNEAIADLDHACLNDLDMFAKTNPSSENLASTIYGRLKKMLLDAALTLAAVEVWESPFTGVSYTTD